MKIAIVNDHWGYDLKKYIIKHLKDYNIKYFLLGNGSNIILSMDYYDGVIIKLDNFNSITYNDNLVTAGAGCSLIKLSLDTIEKGLTGMEFSTGIPGCVGASVAMNAGAYNSDISQVLKEATILTPNNEIKVIDQDTGKPTSILKGCLRSL